MREGRDTRVGQGERSEGEFAHLPFFEKLTPKIWLRLQLDKSKHLH